MSIYWTDRDELHQLLSRLAKGETVSLNGNSYLAGITDLLTLMNLTERSNPDQVSVESEAGRFFLQSLSAHLTDQIQPAFDWETGLDQDRTPAQGSRLLAELEAVRKQRVAQPTPIREVEAVNAIILRREVEGVSLLMQYDPKANQYQLIGGKVEPDDLDATATILREMQEELYRPDLQIPDHFQLTELNDYHTTTLSPSFGVITRYSIQFFHIHDVKFTLPIDAQTQWIELSRVRQGLATDGRKVSDLAWVLGDQLKQLRPSL
jgi:8-oxo-dGTP pyrophosphatase MutT (NUDIX family)